MLFLFKKYLHPFCTVIFAILNKLYYNINRNKIKNRILNKLKAGVTLEKYDEGSTGGKKRISPQMAAEEPRKGKSLPVGILGKKSPQVAEY